MKNNKTQKKLVFDIWHMYHEIIQLTRLQKATKFWDFFNLHFVNVILVHMWRFSVSSKAYWDTFGWEIWTFLYIMWNKHSRLFVYSQLLKTFWLRLCMEKKRVMTLSWIILCISSSGSDSITCVLSDCSSCSILFSR